MSSYGISHRLGLSFTNARVPAASHDNAVREMASSGLLECRRSNCENVPEGCCAHIACESAKAMSTIETFN